MLDVELILTYFSFIFFPSHFQISKSGAEKVILSDGIGFEALLT